jgi:hypothetical protein
VKSTPATRLRDAATSLMTYDPSSPNYARALAVLAGVKCRKARMFCGLDEGTVSEAARIRLEAARTRWTGVIPCSSPMEIWSTMHTHGRTFAFGTRPLADRIVGTMHTAICDAVLIQESGAPGALGALVAALGLPAPVVGAGPVDPTGMVLAHRASASRWRMRPLVVVVTVGSEQGGDDLAAFAARLLPCADGLNLERRLAVCVVVDPRDEALAARHFRGVDGIVRLEIF